MNIHINETLGYPKRTHTLKSPWVLTTPEPPQPIAMLLSQMLNEALS